MRAIVVLVSALALPLVGCQKSDTSASEEPTCSINKPKGPEYCQPQSGCCPLQGKRFVLSKSKECVWIYTPANQVPETVECVRVDGPCPNATAGRCYHRVRNGNDEYVDGSNLLTDADLAHSDWGSCVEDVTNYRDLPQCKEDPPPW